MRGAAGQEAPAARMLRVGRFRSGTKGCFAAHGITHIHRGTDNGACCRSGGFASIVGAKTRKQHTKPCTPRRNGKVERQPRIMAEGLLHARTYNCEDERIAALDGWNIRYNWRRPHSATGGRPAASRLTTGVANVRPS